MKSSSMLIYTFYSINSDFSKFLNRMILYSWKSNNPISIINAQAM